MSSEEGVIVVVAAEGNDQLATEPETARDKHGTSTKNEDPPEELPATEEAETGGEGGETVSDEKNAVTGTGQVTGDEIVQNEAENAGGTEGLLVESGEVEVSVENAIDCTPEIEREGLEARRASDVEAGDDPKSDHAAASATTAPVSSITFHDLGYEVTQRKFFKRLPSKIILDSVRSADWLGAATAIGDSSMERHLNGCITVCCII